MRPWLNLKRVRNFTRSIFKKRRTRILHSSRTLMLSQNGQNAYDYLRFYGVNHNTSIAVLVGIMHPRSGSMMSAENVTAVMQGMIPSQRVILYRMLAVYPPTIAGYLTMAQIAPITVYDGASTPVAHTLVDTQVTREGNKMKALWREQLAGVPVNAQVTAEMTIERLPSGVYRTEVRVAVPVMETVSGQNMAGYTAQPKVAYTNTLVTTGFFHERSDVAGRRLAKQIMANLLNNISTSVASATAGPVSGLIDTLVTPT